LGFRDTHFDFSKRPRHGPRFRYEISGRELPRFLPWVRETLECDVTPKNVNQPRYPTSIPESCIHPDFLAAIQKFLNPAQIDTSGEVRMRHGHGHTQEEMYAIKYTRLGRVPDLVVYPTAEDQVTALVEAAKTHDVSLIPYGGGTNVTDALRCEEHEKRTIVSVDMHRMNRIRGSIPRT
jgi:alkyldihydroxyacetonephosphate synthase